MCVEYESRHDRSGRLDKVMGQSIVLREIKTAVPLQNEDPAHQNLLLQRYEERIKKAKPQRTEPAGYSPSIIPMSARNWNDIEPRKHSLSAYEVSKKVIHLLRHSQQVQRKEDGPVRFWRIKEHLQSRFPQIPHWSDNQWKACLAAGGGAKKRYQYCTDGSRIIIFEFFKDNQDAI